MWKTSMITNKNQIKYCFKIPRNISLSDSECEKRVRYINYKMTEKDYETKDWNKDCMEYMKKETYDLRFDNGDFYCMCLYWYEGAILNGKKYDPNIVAS